MNIQDLANKVCKEIPEGYTIKIVMENGSAWLELGAPCVENLLDGYNNDHSESVEDQVIDLLDKTKQMPGYGDIRDKSEEAYIKNQDREFVVNLWLKEEFAKLH